MEIMSKRSNIENQENIDVKADNLKHITEQLLDSQFNTESTVS